MQGVEFKRDKQQQHLLKTTIAIYLKSMSHCINSWLMFFKHCAKSEYEAAMVTEWREGR